MSKSTSALATLLAASLLGSATLAHAAPPVRAAATSSGASIPGLCLVSQQAVIANSKIGQAANARYQQLVGQVQAELTPEQTALQADARTLNAQKPTLPPAQFDQRAQALNQRAQALQAKGGQRQQQLQATQRKALQTIAGDLQPLVAAVYQSHGCSVLFDRDVVLSGGVNMDLTPALVQALDARATTITFDLEPPAAPAAQ